MTVLRNNTKKPHNKLSKIELSAQVFFTALFSDGELILP